MKYHEDLDVLRKLDSKQVKKVVIAFTGNGFGHEPKVLKGFCRKFNDKERVILVFPKKPTSTRIGAGLKSLELLKVYYNNYSWIFKNFKDKLVFLCLVDLEHIPEDKRDAAQLVNHIQNVLKKYGMSSRCSAVAMFQNTPCLIRCDVKLDNYEVTLFIRIPGVAKELGEEIKQLKVVGKPLQGNKIPDLISRTSKNILKDVFPGFVELFDYLHEN